MTKFLIEQKADVNATSTKGYTVLRLAQNKGHEEVVKVLLQAGASKNGKTNTGEPGCGQQ